MKFLQIFLLFALVISVIMAVDMKIRNIKGGGMSRSRGGTSRRTGSSTGGSNSGNLKINSGSQGTSLTGAQHSPQGIQNHQVDDFSKK